MRTKIILGATGMVVLLVLFTMASFNETAGAVTGNSNEAGIQALTNGSGPSKSPEKQHCEFFRDINGKRWRACKIGVINISAGGSVDLDAEVRVRPGLGR